MTRLAELIKEKETSIRQLAKQSGIPERTVYRHANGETSIDLQQAAAYARALRVQIEALVERSA